MPFQYASLHQKRTPVIALAVLIAFISFSAGIAIGLIQGIDAGKNIVRQELASAATGTDVGYLGSVKGIGSSPPKGLAEDVDFSIFWTIWKDLKEGYYNQPVQDKQLLYGALDGLANALDDPYTTYFEPEDAEDFATALRGEFSGIGAEIGVKDGQLQIIAPLPDTPAERAGIRARDLIMAIDGEESLSMPVDIAVHKIRGERGTEVTLTVGRRISSEGADNELEKIDITITRDTIVIQSVTVEEKQDGIFVIDLRNFNSNSLQEFEQAVEEVKAGNAKGLVIDLRNNPGGYLDRAIQFTGEWVRDDIVVQQRERGVITERYKGTGFGRLAQIPTVVLVNGGSASASEILAGALQDYGIATIVGTQTFGKGSVQDFREYEDGSALKYTIAEWLTPKGRSINEEGITPDIEVEYTEEDFNEDRDPQLEKAIELLRAPQETQD